MIGVFAETGFFPREFLEMPFCRLGAARLQALTQTMRALARLLNLSATESFTRAISGQIDNTQINAHRSLGDIRGWFGNVKGDCQVPCPMAIEQVGLPFDLV